MLGFAPLKANREFTPLVLCNDSAQNPEIPVQKQVKLLRTPAFPASKADH